MRKLFVFLLSGAMIASMTACGGAGSKTTSSTAKTTESKVVSTTAAKDSATTETAIANPWSDYTSLEEAESVAGFEFSFGDEIGNGVYYAKEFRAMQGMLEITYYAEDGTEAEDQFVIRQAKKTTDDISGDDNSYSHDFTVDDCGIEEIRLRGTKNSLAVCSFNYGDYSYVLYPGSMDYTETFIVIGELTGVESEEYSLDESNSDENSIDKFVGDWNCEDTYLESEDGYTGFYALSVQDNGDFSLYDAEAGNPGIAGMMTIDSDSDVTVTCDTEDFDPPAEWTDMAEIQTLQYEFVGDDELHLIYTDGDKTSTLVFHKDQAEE